MKLMCLKRYLFLYIIGLSLLYLHCSLQFAGGGTIETTNGCIIGTFVHQTGTPALQTRVMLLPETYDPVSDAPIPDSQIDTTDALGHYKFTNINAGTYTIQAIAFTQKNRALITGVRLEARDTINIPVDTLRYTGVIKVTLPDSVDYNNGYLYIPGTTITAWLSGAGNYITIDSIPAGVAPSIVYGIHGFSTKRVIRYNVPVISEDTVLVSMPAWKYSMRLYLNTTISGANISENIYNFPVLIRLASNNFNFSEAKPDGSDIRYTKSDGITLLPYEIEHWDTVNKQAAIWVNVDTIYGNNSSQHIYMYWGNQSALGVSNSELVFDTANGFQGVWHLNQSSVATASDATKNHYHGTPSDTAPVSAPGIIGKAQQFDGKSTGFTIKNSASGKLSFPENGTYTVSLWVNREAIISYHEGIIGKGNRQYTIGTIRSDSSTIKFWEFAEYKSKIGNEQSLWPVTENTWTFVVGVRNGVNQYLYVDGVCIDSTISYYNNSAERDTVHDVTIGKIDVVDIPGTLYLFKGKIDEVRLANRSLNADWIRLCYMNQKEVDALIK